MKLSLIPAVASVVSLVAAAAQVGPGASTALTVGPKEFLEACHSDMAKARAGMERFKAAQGGKSVV